MTSRVGQQFGNYRLIQLLGTGGFAEVYLGEHILLETRAAIKVLDTRLQQQEAPTFLKEARIIAGLIHPHIIRLLEFGIEETTPFMVMDYAPNGTLRTRHPLGTQVPLATIVTYVRQIAEALQFAHDENIIHRDIKPVNILLGKRNEILLSDFGIAVIAHNTLSRKSEEVIGTPYYMAPEQIKKYPLPASDQYALGVMVYQWLTGTLPFEGTTDEILAKHLQASPPSLSSKMPLSPEVEQVVLKALAKEPKQRFTSVKDFAGALEQTCHSQKSTIFPTPSSPSAVTLPPTVSMVVSSSPHMALLYTCHGHTDKVTDVAWSPNGQYVASKGNDQKVQIWDTTTGSNIFTYQKNFSFFRRSRSRTVTAIAWSPDGQRIAIADDDSTIQVWNVVTRSKITDHHQSKSTNYLVWSPNGKHIVSDGRRIVHDVVYNKPYNQDVYDVWDATTGQGIFTSDCFSDVVAEWSPDGQQIALNSRMIEVWDIFAKAKRFSYESYSSAIKWSPNGEYLAAGHLTGIMQLWSAVTGLQVFSYSTYSYSIYSDSCPLCGSTDFSGSMICKNCEYPKQNQMRGDILYRLTTLAWSPNCSCIASAGYCYDTHDFSDTRRIKKPIQIWNITTGKCLLIYVGHSNYVNSLTWLSDGQHIISKGPYIRPETWAIGSPEIQIWNITSGKLVFSYSGLDSKAILSPDETCIATTSQDKTLQIWNVSSGTHIFTFPGISGGVNDIAWSPDGTRIASVSDDGKLRIWRVK